MESKPQSFAIYREFKPMRDCFELTIFVRNFEPNSASRYDIETPPIPEWTSADQIFNHVLHEIDEDYDRFNEEHGAGRWPVAQTKVDKTPEFLEELRKQIDEFYIKVFPAV